MMKKPEGSSQMPLPGDATRFSAASAKSMGRRRIHHLEILRAFQDTSSGRANIVDTYAQQVIPHKTRQIQLLGRKMQAEIIETLLGFEVKACYKRIHCPDMVTARYVKLFTELGCHNIRLPYDPTVTASLIPGLELSMAIIKNGVDKMFPQDRKLQLYVMRNLFSRLRSQLKAAAKRAPLSPVQTGADE
jgi:hypothetical protein